MLFTPINLVIFLLFEYLLNPYQRDGNYSNEETQRLEIACVQCERKKRVVIIGSTGLETKYNISSTSSQPKCINHLQHVIFDRKHAQFTKPEEQDSSFIGSLFMVMNKYFENKDRLKDCIDCEKKVVKYKRNLLRTDSSHLEYIHEYIFFSHSNNRQCKNLHIKNRRPKFVPYQDNSKQHIRVSKSGEENSSLIGWIFMMMKQYFKSNNYRIKDCINCQKKFVRYGEAFFPTDSLQIEYILEHIFFSQSNNRQCKNPYIHKKRLKFIPYPNNKRKDITIMQKALKPKSAIMKVAMYFNEEESKKLQAPGSTETNTRDKLFDKIPAQRFFGYFNNERQSILYIPFKHLMCYTDIKQEDYGHHNGRVKSLSNLPQIDEPVETHTVLSSSTSASTQGLSDVEITSFYENAFEESMVEKLTSFSDSEILSSYTKVLELFTKKAEDGELSKTPSHHMESIITSSLEKSRLGVTSLYESIFSGTMVEKVIKSFKAEILSSVELPLKEPDRTFASKQTEVTKSVTPWHGPPKTVSVNDRDLRNFHQEIRDSYTPIGFKQVTASLEIKETNENLLKTSYPNQIKTSVNSEMENMKTESWQIATPVLKEMKLMPLKSNVHSELSYASKVSFAMGSSDDKTAVRINEQGENMMTKRPDIDVAASFKYGTTEDMKTPIIQRSFVSLKASELTVPKSTITPPLLRSNKILDETFRISPRYKKTSFALTGTENDNEARASSKKIINFQSVENLVEKSVAKGIMTESIRDLTEDGNIRYQPERESSTISESSTTSDVPEPKGHYRVKMGAFGPLSIVTKSSRSPISLNAIKENPGKDVPFVYSVYPSLSKNIEELVDIDVGKSRKLHEKIYLQGVGVGVPSPVNEQKGAHQMSRKTSSYQEEETSLMRVSSNLDNFVKKIHSKFGEMNAAGDITRSMEHSLSIATRKSMKEFDNVARSIKDGEDNSRGSGRTYESTSLQRSISANLAGRQKETTLDEMMSLKGIVKATVKFSKTNEHHSIDARKFKIDSTRQETKAAIEIERVLSTNTIVPENEANSLQKCNMGRKFTPQLETATAAIGISADAIVGKDTEKPPYDINKGAGILSESEEEHGAVTGEHKNEVIDVIHGIEQGEINKSPILAAPKEIEEGQIFILSPDIVVLLTLLIIVCYKMAKRSLKRFPPSKGDNNITLIYPPSYPDDHGVSKVPQTPQPLPNTKQPKKMPVNKRPPKLETVVMTIEIFRALDGGMSYEFRQTEKID